MCVADGEKKMSGMYVLMSKYYGVFLLAAFLGGIVKYALGSKEISHYYLEMVCLAGFLGYWLTRICLAGYFAAGSKDDTVQSACRIYRARGTMFMFCFWVYILGNLYYLYYQYNLNVMAINLVIVMGINLAYLIHAGKLKIPLTLPKRQKSENINRLLKKKEYNGGCPLWRVHATDEWQHSM